MSAPSVVLRAALLLSASPPPPQPTNNHIAPAIANAVPARGIKRCFGSRSIGIGCPPRAGCGNTSPHLR
jgi:hypothetical protein